MEQESPNQHRIDAVIHQLMISFGNAYKKETTIIDRSQLKQDYQLLHVSTKDNIKVFLPRFSLRTIDKETQSIMRISTSPGILYCMLGRGDPIGENAFFWGNRAELYTIYGFDWNISVIPSTKLVPDASHTHEHWLIIADPKERAYVPIVHGQFFLHLVEAKPSNNKVERDYTFYLNLKTPTLLYDGIILEKGFWAVKAKSWTQPWAVFSKANVEIEKITEGKFTREYVQRFTKQK